MTVAEYTIEVKGDKEIIRVMERYPQIYREEMTKVITAAVLAVDKAAKEKTPVNTGQLRDSYYREVHHIGAAEVQGAVGSELHYAPYVEFGTKPHFPPRGPIERWAELVLGDASAWFMVARAIAGRGTKPRGMFAKAIVQEKERVRKLLIRGRDEIVKRLKRGG